MSNEYKEIIKQAKERAKLLGQDWTDLDAESKIEYIKECAKNYQKDELTID
ncbi:hypothetical protein [Pantoea agglomerans]|uniref:hypothetical protein n=1 Tax=Enterobacter agglomerans TaxID=549 RepID=UPI0034CF82DE